MEVILLETFDRLGQIGDVVKVKNGFARNYLIPNKKALRANKENKEKFVKIKNDLIEKNNKVVKESNEVIKKIENKEIILLEMQAIMDNFMAQYLQKTLLITLVRKKSQ